jgi:hypothetical protein
MYSSAGCPCPSIKFSATYVIRRPKKLGKKVSHMYVFAQSIIMQLLSQQKMNLIESKS